MEDVQVTIIRISSPSTKNGGADEERVFVSFCGRGKELQTQTRLTDEWLSRIWTFFLLSPFSSLSPPATILVLFSVFINAYPAWPSGYSLCVCLSFFLSPSLCVILPCNSFQLALSRWMILDQKFWSYISPGHCFLVFLFLLSLPSGLAADTRGTREPFATGESTITTAECRVQTACIEQWGITYLSNIDDEAFNLFLSKNLFGFVASRLLPLSAFNSFTLPLSLIQLGTGSWVNCILGCFPANDSFLLTFPGESAFFFFSLFLPFLPFITLKGPLLRPLHPPVFIFTRSLSRQCSPLLKATSTCVLARRCELPFPPENGSTQATGERESKLVEADLQVARSRAHSHLLLTLQITRQEQEREMNDGQIICWGLITFVIFHTWHIIQSVWKYFFRPAFKRRHQWICVAETAKWWYT